MDLNTILQQAQKLTNESKSKDELPNVERTLSQVLQATQELHNRIRKTQDIQDIQAHILLGSKGIDLPKISQKLESINTRKTFEPLDPITDTDVESYLRNERENTILTVIDEVHKNSFKEAQRQKWDNILTEWKHEKTKLMNAMIGPSQNWIDIRKGPEPTILNETRYERRSTLDNQEMAYVRDVNEYNKLITEGTMRPSLVQMFATTVKAFNESKINEIWEIIKYMVNIPPIPKTQDAIKSRGESPHLLIQAKKYLENRYKLYMQTVSSENLREAQRGGIPSTFNLVSSFVSVKFNNVADVSSIGLQDGLVEGKPLWPMVYYSLRCGDIQSALRCVQLARPGNEDIIAVLEEKSKYPERKLNSKLEHQIKLMYKRQIRNATDAYKRTVYCILGYCDISETHAEVVNTSDDFLWIQLSLIGPSANDNIDSLTYSGLQSMILEQYGEKHYNAAEQPFLYVQVLLLTGQFEAAIEFLSRTDKHRTHAVHIALALHEQHLLGGPRNVQEPLLSIDPDDIPPMRRLNIARLIMLYVKKFEITDPAEALQYYYFLRKLHDPEGRNLFLVCVSDLTIQCRDHELIFGKLQTNGIRSRGLIDQFKNIEIDAKTGANLVAEELVQKGMFEDAITLFELAQNIDQAVRYMTILLSQVIHQPIKPGSLKDRLQRKAQELSIRCTSAELVIDSKLMKSFNLLCQLGNFFDQYYENNYQLALDTLDKLNLIPLSMSKLEGSINNFKNLSGEVTKVFPEVLLATMDILYNKYKTVKSKEVNRFENLGYERQLSFLREQAKVITNMAAMIPYRMHGDTNSRLVQIEILMN